MSTEEANAFIEQLAARYPRHELLEAVRSLARETPVAMAAVVAKLDKRKRDVEELLSIAKSAQELQRKVERMADRLLGEEGTET